MEGLDQVSFEAEEIFYEVSFGDDNQQDHAETQQEGQIQNNGEDPGEEQNNLAYLANLTTSGVLLECWKLLRTHRRILWRTAWNFGIPAMIAQTALVTAMSSLVFVMIYVHPLLFHGKAFVIDFLFARTPYIVFLRGSSFILTKIGGLNIEWHSVYIRMLANLIHQFYAPRYASPNFPCTWTVQPLSRSSTTFFQYVYELGSSSSWHIHVLCMSGSVLTGRVTVDLGFPVVIMTSFASLFSNSALPLSAFIASVEKCETYGWEWRCKMLTRGEKFWTAVRLRLLVYALCIPQVLAYIVFWPWFQIIRVPGFVFWQPWVIALVLGGHVVWSTFSTTMNTILGGVLYFSCKAYHGENATYVPADGSDQNNRADARAEAANPSHEFVRLLRQYN